jgi:chlorite dismutase
MINRLFTFHGGDAGAWRVTRLETVVGDPLPRVSRLDVVAGNIPAEITGACWSLRGVTSNERYVTRSEKTKLVERQPGLGRPAATLAALIPIRKTPEWWTLTQDERRRIFEEQSNHIQTGMQFLPAIARRLHHCRDLGPDEPFDFLTWFEYAPSDAPAFEQLVSQLRQSPEWAFVSRETDLRLELA